jgi:hypothetical protein
METTMQLAAFDHSQFFGWKKFFDDADKDEPPIEYGLAVLLSEDAIYSLIDFESGGFYLDPESFGFDIRRLHGEAGRDLFEQLETIYGTPGDDQACCDRLWESFNRDRVATDRLLIDAMDEAQISGWVPPAEVLAELIKLRDLLEARAAQRKAAVHAEEARFRAIVDAELDAEFAVYEKWIAGGEPASDPLAADHIERKRCIQKAQFTRDVKSGKIPMPSNVVLLHPAASSPVVPDAAIKHEDFWAYSPAHSYIFVPNGDHWPASTVNARLAPVEVPMRAKPMAAATWLDQNRSVEQATWAPGQPQILADRLIADGGWINRVGCKTFNLYRPPTIKPKAGDVSPWVDHVRWVYPDEADHIIRWLAQRVQRPDQKINHALVLGGNQGIGKDTLLEPVKAAVGPWNCSEVSPQQVLGRFNSFVKSVILRISEARDLGDTDRFAYYEHLKTLTASPPDVLRVDEKHLREHAVLNCCGVIQTTNNKDALHLPIDDRRHFIAWSPRTKDDFHPGYWSALYQWFAHGGNEIVAHHLATLDLSGFDAKAPPPKTRAFWEIVDASRAPEDAEMADAIDALGKPDAVTVQMVLVKASIGFGEWLRDRKNRRKIGHRFEGCGYVPVRNPDDARDGQWKIAGRRQTVYSKREMVTRDQIAAAQRLTDR